MGRVDGKIALVTGAASGIGRASAELLASEGAKVVLSDIDDTNGEAAAKGIVDAGGEAIFTHLDATNAEEWQAAVDVAVSTFGGLNILVNNAGAGPPGGVEETTPEVWRKAIAINLDSTFLGCKSTLEAIKKSGPGSIINISSAGGIIANPGLVAYCAAKAGVRHLSKCLAIECAGKGYDIRVNSIHPGFIATESAVTTSMAAMGMTDKEEAMNIVNSMTPLGKGGMPIDIAYGVLYLASDESQYVTAIELIIDGGMVAR